MFSFTISSFAVLIKVALMIVIGKMVTAVGQDAGKKLA